VREFSRIHARRIVAHGTHDANGRMASFFVFACASDDDNPHRARLVEILVPFLHSAWIRTKVSLSGEAGAGSDAHASARELLTEREREVLKWVYLGKSNIEIGLILGISPLTVKNHVQEILRRLNVQNRAQAVGKAFSLHILSC
jgi:transcriptional regulator EpsA